MGSISGQKPEEKWESIDEYLKEYEHPIWKEFLNDGVTGGHGGMDYLVLRAFIYCIQNQIETPINVYDAATWMAVTCLSEDSIAMEVCLLPFRISQTANGCALIQCPKVLSHWMTEYKKPAIAAGLPQNATIRRGEMPLRIFYFA